MEQATSQKLKIVGEMTEQAKEILPPEALEFLVALHEKFDARRRELLQRRVERQKRLDAGEKLDFLPETKDIHEGDWTIAPLPPDLQDRRVEITGSAVERKMVINALNSDAKMFMACFEDASTPTWENMIAGQINMHDSVRRTMDLEVLDEELEKIKNAVGEEFYNNGCFEDAAKLFKELIEQDEFVEILTLPGYERIN